MLSRLIALAARYRDHALVTSAPDPYEGPTAPSRGHSGDPRPILSICVPTYNRPQLLERALRSVIDVPHPAPGAIELVISDNSDNDESGDLSRRLLKDWQGPGRYVRNEPPLGAEENFNRCLELARGQWVLLLHDDDYLIHGPGPILDAIGTSQPRDQVMLFGVYVVDEHERRIRRQTFWRERRLAPQQALARVLTNSSWVRFPALVARLDAYQEVGPFDTSVRNPCDFDMWIRLFSRYGVRCISVVSCSYSVHSGALTDKMFGVETIDTLAGIFDKVVDQGLLPKRDVRNREAAFFHQFILGATWRRLKTRDRRGAKTLMGLFAHPEVHALGLSPRWAPVRFVFTGVTMGARL